LYKEDIYSAEFEVEKLNREINSAKQYLQEQENNSQNNKKITTK
jgi:hypothetical protein